MITLICFQFFPWLVVSLNPLCFLCSAWSTLCLIPVITKPFVSSAFPFLPLFFFIIYFGFLILHVALSSMACPWPVLWLCFFPMILTCLQVCLINALDLHVHPHPLHAPTTLRNCTFSQIYERIFQQSMVGKENNVQEPKTHWWTILLCGIVWLSFAFCYV